jgi:hypothetical protein
MPHLGAGHHLEQFGSQVLSGAIAGRGIVDLAGLRFQQSDELLDRLHRQVVVHDDEERIVGKHRHRREIRERVVG